MNKRYISAFLAFSATVILFVGAAFGQGTTSRVTGTVTDNAGAAVAGATVTLTNQGTNTELTTQTGGSGAYAFDLIQIGTYQITIEKPGFKKFVSTGNNVQINQPATINTALEIGDVSAVVSVESAAEAVQTSSSGNIGSTIDQRTIESLPIVGARGRNPLDLLNFQPGVVIGGNTGGGVNVNGSRDRAFNFTLDGIDINESSAGGSNFTPLRPNPDSIQEFQIVTSNFTAELGRSCGAQVTFVTKSGTNQIHGNAFEYYQTPRFNAKAYTNTINNLPKDQFVQNIFGGSIGGPIVKDKLFYFGNLQLLRAYDTALVTRTVYTAAARAGQFRYYLAPTPTAGSPSVQLVDAAGNPLVPNCSATVTSQCLNTYNIASNPSGITLDPTLSAAINAQPLPNNFTTGDGLNTAGYSFGSPQHEKQYDFVTKFDYALNQNNAFYLRYAQGNQNSLGDSGNGGRPIFPDSPNLVDTFRNPKNLAINYRWSPTAKLTNEFIFGLSKFAFSFDTPKPDPTIPYTFLDINTANTNFVRNARRLRTIQFVDNVTFDFSPHIIKAGTNFRFGRQIDDRSSVAGIGLEPTVTFSGAAGYTAFALPAAQTPTVAGINSTDLSRLQNTINNLLGRVGTVSQAFVSNPDDPNSFAPLGTRWNFTAKYPELDFYAQDNWKARQNLTFDFGLRWEPKLNPRSEGRPILVPNQPFTYGSAPSNNLKWVEGKLFKSDFSKLLPSIGFAWDPFKTGKTSIRANYRISSDRIATQLFAASIYQNIPGNALGATNSTYGQGGGLFRNVAPVITALVPSSTPAALRQPAAFGTGSINVIDPDLQFPQIHSWSLSFQREVSKNNVVEINYIGKHGVHLLGGYNVNQVNVNAAVGGVGNFLDEFNSVRGNAAYNSPLINLLLSGNAANNGGTARFRTFNTTALNNGGAASLALAVSQKTCVTADVTAGICTSAQIGQRLLDINGFSSFLQPYSQFTGGMNVFDSNDYSHYNSLELIFKRRFYNGLGFQVGYTLSKSKDSRSWDPSLSTISTGAAQSASSTPFDNRDRRINYTYSDFDRRHVLQGTYVYELPFGKGKRLASDTPKAVDYIIGGWQVSGTLLLMSGRPFTVYSGFNSLSNVVQSTADCAGCSRNLGKLVIESGKNYYFDTAARAKFAVPAAGTYGNTGRNFFIAPRYFQTDISLSKKFRITERISFDLRADARNLTNTPSFDLPTAVYSNSAGNIFGRINDSVTNNARRMQFSGKISF